ncbi:MAG: hypothetical protein JW867_03190 [Candidatus Omnitrophica bacterium]|nr:hypothetical protein [Candidatus Omnitrophota bacterium]
MQTIVKQKPPSKTFDYGSIDTGYYDKVYRLSKGIQSKWHHLKFSYIRGLMKGCRSHLDIGCGPGSFIASLGDNISSFIFLLKEALRVLKPKGMILIATPNYHSLWPLLEWFVNKLGKISYSQQHITPFRPKSLKLLLDEAGFCSCSIDCFQFLAPFFACLSWSLADKIENIEPDILKKSLVSISWAKGFKP